MPKGYTTINVKTTLNDELIALAQKVAEKEGLSKISQAGLIERMKKRYEDTEKF